MNSDEVLSILKRLDAVFNGMVKSPEAVAVWCDVLKRYPTEAVNKAFKTVLETCKYAPKPADFVDAINKQPKKQRDYLPHHETKHSNMVKTSTGWERPERCVKVGDRWLKKIEFVMEVLGAETVTAMIKEELEIQNLRAMFTPKYEKFLNEVLMPMAKHDFESNKNL